MDLLAQALAREAEHNQVTVPEVLAFETGETFRCVVCGQVKSEAAFAGSDICLECADAAGVQTE